MIGIDIKMPKACMCCDLEYWADGYGDRCSATFAKTTHNREKSRHPDCPLHLLDDDEIRIGDEVITSYGARAVVLGIDSRTDSLFTVCSDGSCGTHGAQHFTKTGRHFDEAEALLKKMRGNKDG